MNGYLLDEHLPSRWIPQLRKRLSVDVRTVGREGTPPKGSSDKHLLEWTEKEGFIFISQDRRTIPEHFREHLAAGRHSIGVFLLRRNMTIRVLLDELAIITAASLEGEYQDQIRYLPML